ncbi:hypothetical protein ACTXT7_007710 [Hymenolepis weldensis]
MQGVRNPKSVKTSPSSGPHKEQKESVNRSSERELSPNRRPTSPPMIKQEDVDDAQRELISQIHDLVNLECSSAAKKAEQMKKASYKDRSPKEPPKDENAISFLRVRQHQFRWSERHQRPSPYSAMRPPVLKGPEEGKESEIIPGTDESSKPDDFEEKKEEPASRIISMLVPHMQDGIPIWVFSAGQLNVLRRMAQTQLTLTHERVCPSNRLIKWRIGRKTSQPKALTSVTPQATPRSSQQELSQPPVSIVLNQHTESSPCDGKLSPLSSTITSSESENSPSAAKTPDSTNDESAFWPELKEGVDSSTDLVAVNSYGASRSFTGPLFGRTLTFWQHRVGYPFPPCICNMLSYLQQAEHAAHGIFRRAGGKLRVQALRERIEKDICEKFRDFPPRSEKTYGTNNIDRDFINRVHPMGNLGKVALFELAAFIELLGLRKHPLLESVLSLFRKVNRLPQPYPKLEDQGSNLKNILLDRRSRMREEGRKKEEVMGIGREGKIDINATKDSIRDVPSGFPDRHMTDETQEF